jgi:hypothetical protein
MPALEPGCCSLRRDAVAPAKKVCERDQRDRLDQPRHVKESSFSFSEFVLWCGHPASLGGALRAIVTTREAGSDGRDQAAA